MTDKKPKMGAAAYDRMVADGYDMSGWERVEPVPGAPVYKVRFTTNRAERRAARTKGGKPVV